MKRFVFCFLFLLGFQLITAKCGVDSMNFYPKEAVINQNSIFVIEGTGALSAKTVASFTDRKVYLESRSGAIVELKLREVLYSKMNVVQAIFVPSKALQPKTKYFLKYENQTTKETKAMKAHKRFSRGSKAIFWTTNDTATVFEFPKNTDITYKDALVVAYGYGPEVYVNFDLNTVVNERVWYRTELLNVATNTTSVFYIQSKNDILRVGHGMCFGAFSFDKKGTYKVRFTPVNLDGKTAKSTDWIAFKNPFEDQKASGF